MTLSRYIFPIVALSLLATAALAESQLADLIQGDRFDAALQLIDEGYDVNVAQPDGTTALHWAAYKLDLPLVERLLESGAQADVSNNYGATPLAEAVKAVDEPLVRLLLDAGADPDSANADGQTALMLAADIGALDIARTLVEYGATVDAREHWRQQTALMWAIDGRFAQLAQFLIEAGADVTLRAASTDWGSQITSEPRAQYRDTGGLTPLLLATRSGCPACAEAVLAAGAAIDRPTLEGVTPLMLALDNMNFDVAALLLEHGANFHYADWWGRTALYIAVDVNTGMEGGRTAGVTSLDLIERLLADGAEVNTQLNFHRPGRAGGINSARFGDDLLTTGATPLLRASITHDHAAMRMLLAHGAQVDLPNVMGVTPLMAAASLGVRFHPQIFSRTPDFENDPALEDKVIESLTILLEAGADINAAVTDISSRSARIARPSQLTDRAGQTGLFRAAGRGWTRVVAFMLENGADAEHVDALGRQAVDAAMGRLASGDPVYEDTAALLD